MSSGALTMMREAVERSDFDAPKPVHLFCAAHPADFHDLRLLRSREGRYYWEPQPMARVRLPGVTLHVKPDPSVPVGEPIIDDPMAYIHALR